MDSSGGNGTAGMSEAIWDIAYAEGFSAGSDAARNPPADALLSEHAAGLEIAFDGILRGPLANALLVEARRRRKEPVQLVADLLATAIADNLFAALLDG